MINKDGYMNRPISKRRRPMVLDFGSGSMIPDEVLLLEILVRLPVKSLVRFKSVCKAWRAAIASPHFVRLQLELARPRSSSMVLVPRKYIQEPKKMASRFVHFYSFQPAAWSKIANLIMKNKRRPNGIPLFTIPLHCDGLILIPSITGRIFVCNPATKEFVELPRGSWNVSLDQRVAFGFDPSSGTYKVARHFLRSYTEGQIRTEYDVGHEVLTLGDGTGRETLEWKATIDPPYPIKARTPICLPGFFYWSAVQAVADANHGKLDATDVILRFSMRDETFTVHPNPPCRSFLSPNDLMCELSGKLCYVHSPSPCEVSIWLAQDRQDIITWSLCCRVNLPIPRTLRVYACASLVDQGAVYLSVDARHLFKCNLRDGSLETVVNMPYGVLYNHGEGVTFFYGSHPFAHYMVPYVESLLHIGPC